MNLWPIFTQIDEGVFEMVLTKPMTMHRNQIKVLGNRHKSGPPHKLPTPPPH